MGGAMMTVKDGDAMEDELLTIKETADMLRMSATWLYDHKDEIGFYRLGGSIRFRRSEVERWIEQQKVAEKQSPPPPKTESTTEEFTILDGDRLKEAWKKS